MGPTCATVNDEAAVFAGSLLVFFFFEPREPLSSSKYFLVADWACLVDLKPPTYAVCMITMAAG